MKRSLAGLTVVVFAVVVSLWWGCADTEGVGGVGEKCYSDGTCDASLVCVNGICVPEGSNNGHNSGNSGDGYCGDGHINGNEECDGLDLGDHSPRCEDYGYHGGAVRCTDECKLDFSECEVTGRCGDGKLDPGEECDGTDFGSLDPDCESQGYYGGSVLCTTDCKLDYSMCELAGRCGDGIKNGPEECDGDDFAFGDGKGSTSCADYGKGQGTVSCTSDCHYDFSGCSGPVTCGNGQIDPGEECDGNAFAPGVKSNCTDYGYYAGVVGCDSGCHITTQPCESFGRCGDGILQTQYGEECDGNQFEGASSCVSYGYYGGMVGCTSQCKKDLSTCESFGRCGDGSLQSQYEECDGADLGTLDPDCTSYGYYGGTLGCDTSCSLDYSECESFGKCGDGEIQSSYGEECDGQNLNGRTCVTRGWLGGTLACDANCSFDESGCEELKILTSGGDYEKANDVAVDSSGNIYVVGTTKVAIGSFTPTGTYSGYVAKYSRNGTLRWVSGIKAANWSRLWGVDVDSSGNVYVVGEYNGSFSLGGQNYSHEGNTDAVLVKFDSSGNPLWVKRVATNQWDQFSDVVVGASGNVYVAGASRGSPFGQLNLYLQWGGLMVKYRGSDGSRLRAWQELSQDDSEAFPVVFYAVAVNESANRVYFGGYYYYYSGGAAVLVRDADDFEYQRKVQLDDDGSSSDQKSYVYGLSVDSSGNVYVSVTSSVQIASAPRYGGKDCYVLKYNSAMNSRAWAASIGSSGDDLCYRIANDTVNNVYVALALRSSSHYTSKGNTDAVVAKFKSTDGSLMKVRGWGGTGGDELWGVALDGAKAFVGAGVSGSSTFEGENCSPLDAFIVRLPPRLP